MSEGLYLMFSGTRTIVRPTPKRSITFQAGELSCRIFQGETYYALSTLIRNYVLLYVNGEKPLTQDSLDEALQCVSGFFRYDDFRPASHLGIAAFQHVVEGVLDEGLDCCLEKVRKLCESGHELLIPISECRTVRDFLCMCFDFYLQDLEDGRTAFESLAAVKAGTANAEAKRIFSDFLGMTMQLPPVELKVSFDSQLKDFVSTYRVVSFRSYMALEYMRLYGVKVKFQRCRNPLCGKIFVAMRSTAMYCDFPSPQDEEKSCKEFYPQMASRMKMNHDVMLKKVRSTQCRLYNVSRRHPDKSCAVGRLLDEIKDNKTQYMQQVSEGKKTMSEFGAWLDSMRIKED